MGKLAIDIHRWGMGVNCMRITGFSEEELSRMRGMKDAELQDEVLRILDERNGNTGTCWQCGYGVYGTSLGADCVYVNVGTSCD